ncbi:MAG: SURF1 family protein [Angustibacter sp.]
MGSSAGAEARQVRPSELATVVVLAITVAVGCVLLGSWQYGRYQNKTERLDRIQRNYDARPVPVGVVLPDPGRPLDQRDEWRPVQVEGRYLAEATVLVRNRPRPATGDADPVYGFVVVTALELSDGRVLWVDRGWVPNAVDGARAGVVPDRAPAPPTGAVVAVVTLRPSEPDRGGQLPAGQVASIAVPRLTAGLADSDVVVPQIDPRRVYQTAYGALRSQTPPATSTPVPQPRPQVDGSRGINASYAVQWLVFAGLALGFPVWWWRTHRDSGSGPGASGTRRRGPTRRRTSWLGADEEAEQAEIDRAAPQ